MIGGVLLEFLIIPLNFILKSNVQFTLAYMDEQVEWKVKKHIARFNIFQFFYSALGNILHDLHIN